MDELSEHIRRSYSGLARMNTDIYRDGDLRCRVCGSPLSVNPVEAMEHAQDCAELRGIDPRLHRP